MNTITSPPFHVMDRSLGPRKMTISESTGLSILGMKSDVAIENWKWLDMSHVTVKSHKMRIIQLKKLSGVKMVLKFWSLDELDRFQRILKNSHPIKVTINKRFQRKLIILKAARKSENPNPAPSFLQANLLPSPTCAVPRPTIESNAELVEARNNIFPPPPPPKAPMKPKLVKKQVQPDALISKSSCLDEMKAKFAGGILKASQIKAMIASQQCDARKPMFFKVGPNLNIMKPKPTIERIQEDEPVDEPNLRDINNNEEDDDEGDIPPALSNSPTNLGEKNYRIWTSQLGERPIVDQAFPASVRRDLYTNMRDKLPEICLESNVEI